jgi:hypothetical protein
MFGVDGSTIQCTVPEKLCTFSAVSWVPLEEFSWKFVPDISDADSRKLSGYWCSWYISPSTLYLHSMRKEIVRPYIVRRADSGKTQSRCREKCGYGLETVRFLAIVIKAGSRRRGMCCVWEFRGAKNSANSASVQNVCVCVCKGLTDRQLKWKATVARY